MLRFCGKIIQQQRYYTFCAGHEFRWVDAQIKIIFHVLHLAVKALVKPAFEAPRIVVEFNRLSDPTLVESKLDG